MARGTYQEEGHEGIALLLDEGFVRLVIVQFEGVPLCAVSEPVVDDGFGQGIRVLGRQAAVPRGSLNRQASHWAPMPSTSTAAKEMRSVSDMRIGLLRPGVDGSGRGGLRAGKAYGLGGFRIARLSLLQPHVNRVDAMGP